MNITYYDTPLGQVSMAAKDHKLYGLWIEGQTYYQATLQEEVVVNDSLAIFQNVKQWLDAYFAGEQPCIAQIPMQINGSTFRKEVWKMLCEIPYGHVITYGEIAQRMASKMGKAHMSAQAVGGAVGHNPISIIIPCHRVIGAHGKLTGYAGGIEKKSWLLSHEDANL